MFLAECGNINMVWGEDGSVNYIIDKQIDGIVDDFEIGRGGMRLGLMLTVRWGLMGLYQWRLEKDG